MNQGIQYEYFQDAGEDKEQTWGEWFKWLMKWMFISLAIVLAIAGIIIGIMYYFFYPYLQSICVSPFAYGILTVAPTILEIVGIALSVIGIGIPIVAIGMFIEVFTAVCDFMRDGWTFDLTLDIISLIPLFGLIGNVIKTYRFVRDVLF